MSEIEHSSSFFLSILQNSTDLISIIDASGNYKFVGGSVKAILGYTPEEMVGTSAFGYIHEQDQEQTGLALQQAITHKFASLPVFRFRTKAGAWRWIECSVTNLADNPEVMGFVTNSRDVTDRVEEEARKKESQAHYEALFYNHPDAAFELNQQGHFSKINQMVSKVLEYDNHQILGHHFQKFVHPDFMPAATEAFFHTMSGKTQYLEISVVRKSGTTGILGITVLPVIIHNQVVSLLGIAKDITLQKQYDIQVQQQANLLNNLIEHIPEAFYSLDRNWCYQYVNAYYASYVGKTREELLGQPIWDVFPGARTTRFYQECHRVRQTGIPASFQEVISYKEDSIINFRIFPSAGGLTIHFIDVTQQRQQQEKLEKLSLIAQKTATCMLVMNQQWEIEWVNEAFEKVLGYPLRACLGKHPGQLLFGPHAREHEKIRRKVSKNGVYRGEVLNYTRAGAEMWFNLEISPVTDRQGQVLQYIAIRTDITDRKKKEAELIVVTQDLFKQNRDLQQFSYMVSHNLRAPAANLIGLSNLLGTLEKQTADFDQTLKMVSSSALLLDEVIREMNQVLSIREVYHAPNLEEVNLKEMLDQVLALLQPRLQGFTHEITTQIEEDFVFKSDKVYLLEVLKNLLSNAIKFRKRNEVLRIKLEARQGNQSIKLRVQDNGIGMDMGLVSKDLFKPYKKFHPGYEGRGIGLFLVKTYLEVLGGKVKITSLPEKGTTLQVNILCH